MRIQFTIRDLLLTTTIVALAVGWWLDHRKFVTRDDPVAQTYSLKNNDPKDVRDILRSVYTRGGVFYRALQGRNCMNPLPTRGVVAAGSSTTG
jgi:hypothetical protein